MREARLRGELPARNVRARTPTAGCTTTGTTTAGTTCGFWEEKCSGFRIRAEALEKAVLEHLADRLFTSERCKQILQDIVEETGILRQKTTEHRRQVERDLEHIEKRLRKWQDAFEAGDKAAIALGADRVAELKAKREELQQTLRKVVLLRPPPPNLYTEASIQKFQESIRLIFLSQDHALTKSYLRFLVEKVIVNGPRVQLITRSEARPDDGCRGPPRPRDRLGTWTRRFLPLSSREWLRLQDSNLRPGG